MTLRINGATSGYTEIDAPAAAGNNTLVLPTGNGTNGQVLQTNGSGVLSWATGLPTGGTNGQVLQTNGSGTLSWATPTQYWQAVLGTAQASTGGTVVEFTGLPSWAKRVQIIFSGVSLSGTDQIITQLGISSGYQTSGYAGSGGRGGTNLLFTTGFSHGYYGAATDTRHGSGQIINITGNTWVFNGNIALSNVAETGFGAGSVTLSGTLDRIRVTVTGTNTFDAGTINILYEG